MKKIRKIIAGLCACTILAGTAAGCSGPGEEEETTQATTTSIGNVDQALKKNMTEALSVFGAQLFKNTIKNEEK